MNALEMRQERAALVREMVTLSQSNDASSVARWKQLDAKQESLRTTIEQSERASALSTEMNMVPNGERPNIGNEHEYDQRTVLTPNQEARSTKQNRADFERWLHTPANVPRNCELLARLPALMALP